MLLKSLNGKCQFIDDVGKNHFFKRLSVKSQMIVFVLTLLISVGYGDTPLNSDIGYINKQIPGTNVAPVKGEYYEGVMPDTLNLAERAKLAIHAMCSLTDAEMDYEPYFRVNLIFDPPRMIHNYDAFQGNGPKYLEAMALLRVMTGSHYKDQVDRRWLKVYLSMQGEDGLLYASLKGRPWGLDGTGLGEDSVAAKTGQLASIYGNGRALLGLTAWNKRLKDPEIWEALKRLVSGLAAHAVDKGDYCYFTGNFFGLTEKPMDKPYATRLVGGVKHGDRSVPVIQGCVKLYEAIGYEPAIELAGKLVKFLVDESGLYDDKGHFVGHFHLHTFGLLAILDYALVTDNKELMEFARSGYEFARSLGCRETGFYPEYWPKAPQERAQFTTETCCLANMLALSTKLSKAGLGDYWDDADYCVRNQFVENQMLQTDWRTNLSPKPQSIPLEKWATDKNVMFRNVGCFAGWVSGNDLFPYPIEGIGPVGFMHCCTGNGSRAIYYVWESVIEQKKDSVYVNLLLNRASPKLDVYSFLPYDGRVDLLIKQNCNLKVRIPAWVNREEVTVTKDRQPVKAKWDGSFVIVESACKGSKVRVNFPQPIQKLQANMGGPEYTVTLKGGTVIDIDPEGKVYPLYQRDGYKYDSIPWSVVNCFVPEEEIDW